VAPGVAEDPDAPWSHCTLMYALPRVAQTPSQALLLPHVGESMEVALRTCCKGIKIGKILVHRHHGMRPLRSRSLTNLSTAEASSNSGKLDGGVSAVSVVSKPQCNGCVANGNGCSSRPASGFANGDDYSADIIYEKLPEDIAERHVLLMVCARGWCWVGADSVGLRCGGWLIADQCGQYLASSSRHTSISAAQPAAHPSNSHHYVCSCVLGCDWF